LLADSDWSSDVCSSDLMPKNRASADLHHGLRFEMGFFTDASSETACEDYCFHYSNLKGHALNLDRWEVCKRLACNLHSLRFTSFTFYLTELRAVTSWRSNWRG